VNQDSRGSDEARRTLEGDEKRALDFVASLRDFYGDYRTKKEREAYATTVLYLGATFVVLSHPELSVHGCLIPSGTFVATLVVIALVRWQIGNLLFAARMVGASVTVNTQWLERPPKPRELRTTRLSEQHPNTFLPETMADEFNRQRVCALQCSTNRSAILVAPVGGSRHLAPSFLVHLVIQILPDTVDPRGPKR